MNRSVLPIVGCLALAVLLWKISIGEEQQSSRRAFVQPVAAVDNSHQPPEVGRFQVTTAAAANQTPMIVAFDTVTGHCWTKTQHTQWEDLGIPPMHSANQLAGRGGLRRPLEPALYSEPEKQPQSFAEPPQFGLPERQP
jgi:hypothetical protein